MKLIYKETGKEVAVDDHLVLSNGELVRVTGWQKPHHSGSSGRIYVQFDSGRGQGFFPSVCGAEWIEREDREED